ncbi:MAG: hypothetical protein ACPGJE_01360 [Wenzhouxiangellaceae bacterium]
MKRKTLTTAVLAGLTGVAGMVGVSNAVNLNPDGLGQVLLYPYYTARGGNDTLISVVNTTENAKSVKIRFLEGRNSREVLDFNIYLSAFDVWTGAVTETADGSNAELVIADRTCTVPYFVGSAPDGVARVPFSNVEFIDFQGLSPDKVDGAGEELERTKSGYFEILEMGTLVDLTNDSATAATHVDGEPADCDQLVTAWTRPQAGGTPAPENYWVIDNLVDHDVPSGGLFGSASIINVGEGTLLSYNAEAMDNWTDAINHTDPGAVTPRIISGTNNVSAVFISGAQQVDVRPWLNNRDAVNAVLMNNQILNEYVVSPNTDGLTEWVLTHPTKRFSVDPLIIGAGATVAVPPFSVVFNSEAARPGTSCEPITFRLWDREEIELADDPIGVIPPRPSPLPPTPPEEPDTFDLCYEANVVRFLRVDVSGTDPVLPGDNDAVTELAPTNTEILGENRFTTLFMPSNFISGWSQFNFDPENINPLLGFPATARRISSLDGVDYVGLPVIGFQASTVANNTLVVDGQQVLSNYGGTFKHRGSRRIEATPTAPPQP